MHIDLASWGWPQWTVLILMFLGLTYRAANHGKPMIDKATGKPEEHNAFIGFCRFLLWGFILTAGGFFA